MASALGGAGWAPVILLNAASIALLIVLAVFMVPL